LNYSSPRTTVALENGSAATVPQASRQKSLDSPKKFTRSEKKITRFEVFTSKFAVLLEMMYLFTLLPKNLYIICKFVKIDHVEAWKISY